MSKGSKESKESAITRRDFLKRGAGATASGFSAMSGFAEIVLPRILNANDRVRVAVIGLHGRGKDHIHELAGLPNVELAALCDVYEPTLNRRLAEVEKMGRPDPATGIMSRDFRMSQGLRPRGETLRTLQAVWD